MDADIKAHIDAISASAQDKEAAPFLALLGIALTELRMLRRAIEGIAAKSKASQSS